MADTTTHMTIDQAVATVNAIVVDFGVVRGVPVHARLAVDKPGLAAMIRRAQRSGSRMVTGGTFWVIDESIPRTERVVEVASMPLDGELERRVQAAGVRPIAVGEFERLAPLDPRD